MDICQNSGNSATIFSLPREILEKIILRLSYDEITKIRLVCKSFDYICQDLLNRGFRRAERAVYECQRDIKSQLPRRESERRSHPLTLKSDILAALETRISLLNMTIMKYANQGPCCFIAGRVLDEVFRILPLVAISSPCSPGRPHEVLQELRDVSSMAMEYFEETLLPLYNIKDKSEGPNFYNLQSGLTAHQKAVLSGLRPFPLFQKTLAPGKLSSLATDSTECIHGNDDVELPNQIERKMILLQRTMVELRASQKELAARNILLEGTTALQAKRIQVLECLLNHSPQKRPPDDNPSTSTDEAISYDQVSINHELSIEVPTKHKLSKNVFTSQETSTSNKKLMPSAPVQIKKRRVE